MMILSAIFGFAAPFLPALLNYFSKKADNAHELEMFKARLTMATQEHQWKMEEISAHADIAESTQLYTPQPSFGVQMLDAAKGWGMGAWATIPAFYLFTLLDLISGLVRPTITYAAFSAYAGVKIAQFMTLTGPRFENTYAEAAIQLWGEPDQSLLLLVLSYWFGLRHYKAVFGGSAGDAKSAPR